MNKDILKMCAAIMVGGLIAGIGMNNINRREEKSFEEYCDEIDEIFGDVEEESL